MVRSSTAVSGKGHTWGRMGDRGTIRDQRLGTVHSQPGNPGTGRASPGPRATTHHRHGTGATPRGRDDRTAAPRLPSGWPIPRPARGGIGIITDMTATTPGAAGGVDREPGDRGRGGPGGSGGRRPVVDPGRRRALADRDHRRRHRPSGGGGDHPLSPGRRAAPDLGGDPGRHLRRNPPNSARGPV